MGTQSPCGDETAQLPHLIVFEAAGQPRPAYAACAGEGSLFVLRLGVGATVMPIMSAVATRVAAGH